LTYIGVFIDITEQKEMMQELAQQRESLSIALEEANQANKAKTAFLSNMSHEIRTPMNAVIGMADLAIHEDISPTAKEYIEQIHSSGKALLHIINDILDFSKITSGKMNIFEEPYSFEKIIRDVAPIIITRLGDKSDKVDLTIDIDPGLPTKLIGDPSRIQQIIINLANNAVKFTNSGYINISVKVTASESDSVRIKVSVQDTGIGIKAEDIEKLFSPYERIEEQRNKKVEGTGLGMSITKNLLEKMGSRLEVSSVYGEGSDFSFVIAQSVIRSEKIGDYRLRENEDDTAGNDVEKYHAPEGQILIVDDVEMNLIVACNLLKRIEIQVDTALSGMAAVEAAKNKQYDIIFLDSMMPEMNGEETMHAIRKQCELNAQTPIIVLTAHAVKGAREEYLNLGYTNYLSKPIDGAKLEAMIQSYLPDEKIIFDFEKKDADKTDLESSESETDSVLKQISEIEGIDAVKGAETAGGEEAYLIICKNFYDTAKMRIEMIREAYAKEDYDAYTIQVHALKSSARLIGAAKFSEEALELETAGRESNIDLIKEKTAGIIDKYEWYYDKLGEVFGDKESDDERPEIPEEDLKQCLSEMSELLEAFDMDTAKELFESLADYKMPTGYKDMYERMKGKMAELDRDGLLTEIQGGR
jgi:CheY-like chemotaxis protein/HPt (histidine-containing phosphotransfer) domain-containing protein